MFNIIGMFFMVAILSVLVLGTCLSVQDKQAAYLRRKECKTDSSRDI